MPGACRAGERRLQIDRSGPFFTVFLPHSRLRLALRADDFAQLRHLTVDARLTPGPVALPQHALHGLHHQKRFLEVAALKV